MWICVVVVLFVVFKDGWFWCSLWYWACCILVIDCIAYLLLLLLLLLVLVLVALIHKLYIIHNLIVYSLKIFNPFSSYALPTGHPPNIRTLLIIISYKLECHVAFLKVNMYNILVDESYILYSFYLYLLMEVRICLM